MDKKEASEKAYDLVAEMVKQGNVMGSSSGDPKHLAKTRAEYLTEMHRILKEYFETVQDS